MLKKASGGKLSPTSSLYIGKSQFNKKVVIDLENWGSTHLFAFPWMYTDSTGINAFNEA